MRIDIITLFPELCDYILSESIIGRARTAGILDIRTHNIRDFSHNKHRHVDDTPYGGGKGMIIAAPPVCECYDSVVSDLSENETVHTVYMSPAGSLLNQKKASELASFNRLVILCGHYEGIDERAVSAVCDEEISIGNYVLTGGELPACILADCVGRLVPGVLAAPECHEMESIACGMLEYPQYTRPVDFNGERVPDVLLNGDHAAVEKWRYLAALEKTRRKRPDLL